MSSTIAIGAGLSMRTPVPVAPSDGQAVDSRAATFTGDGIAVVVDEGPFATSLDRGRREARTIAGQPAQLVSWTDPDGAQTAGVVLRMPSGDTATITVRADAVLGPDAAVRAIESLSSSPPPPPHGQTI
ncbi:hypothetical protein KOI35_24275 [Actinoplanes bogorensis]|uniref:Uncharacterized protein n=1 Tax=Paractinoplanes bogorensis TaxID=1610840 RepID=A0ABS5YWZ7_9ACTN|nr:hypothetical protein [Actinoplanes bogorensis]MBU2666630.1 hypothetical protein [Actinoplanes bogorensis]